MMAFRFSQSICIIAMTLSLFVLAEATPLSSSSQPSAIVRGMMDSDNQMLYMTVSGESAPRGGGERGEEVERSVTVESSSSSSNPQTEQMHRAVVTKEMSFKDIVRKRAFLPRDNGSLF